MPGKKKGGKSKQQDDEDAPTPEQLVANYTKVAKALGVKPEPSLTRDILDEERETPFVSAALADVPIGPAGVRAFVAGVLREPLGGQRMAGKKPYNILTALRFRRCAAGDDGAAAVAHLLTATAQEEPEAPPHRVMTSLVFVDLMANHIGERGAGALGRALATCPPALVRLDLSHNRALAGAGMEALCEGLTRNTVLKRLELNFCGLTLDDAAHIATVLASPTLPLATLEVQGNDLRSRGAAMLAVPLRRNATLTALNLSDNGIGGYPPQDEDLVYLRKFVDALLPNQTLTNLDLLNNGLGLEGAAIMKPLVVGRDVFAYFRVDATLPKEELEVLVKMGKPKAKKGKKGKKKKK